MKFEILNLDEIPQDSHRIKWKDISVGFTFKVIHEKYGYKEFILKEYNKSYLHFEGIDKKIKTSHFLNGNIGSIINEITKDFKIDIGANFKDEKRDLIITDREYRKDKNDKNRKWYKYTCSKCGWTEGWIEEGNLKIGNGCSCCAGKTCIPEINSIWIREPWMVDLGVSEEDAKKYTSQSGKRIEVACPDCGVKKEIEICNIFHNKSIGCKKCGDGLKYPEKFMTNILTQLKLDFLPQLTKITFDWCDKYKYDFYLPDYNVIIETHGEQHYNNTGEFKRTLDEEQENDRLKQELALKNGINRYIVIDCRHSNLEWIKNSVLNSELANMFNLSEIDWLECEKFALNNLVKEVCEYWNNKEEWETTQTIADNNPWGIKSGATIRKYVKIGDKLGWTTYDVKKERDKAYKKAKEILITRCSKQVEIFKDGVSLGIFKSGCELERQSEGKFGTKLFQANISSVCRGESKCYKGFVFKYL